MLRYRTIRKAARVLQTGQLSKGEAQYFARDAVRMARKQKRKSARKARERTVADRSADQTRMWNRLMR